MQQAMAGSFCPRFVRLMLEQDLLGNWELVQETGQVGGKSRIRRELFMDRDQALVALEAIREKHARRGFEIIAGGPESTDAPHLPSETPHNDQ